MAVAILLLAGCLRGYRLGQQPLRGDEAFSVRFAALPVETLWTALAESEPNPPLQFLFLRGWMAAAGGREFAVRWPSALAGLLVAAVGLQAARALAGRPAALLVGLWLAVNPFLIWYGQDVRVYSALAAAVTAAGWATWRASQKSTLWRWIAAGGLWWLSLQLHYLAAVTLAAVGLAFVLTPATRSRWRPALLTGAVFGLAYLPWAIYSLPLLAGHTKSWLAPVSAWDLVTRTLTAYSVGGRFAGAIDAVQAVGAALAGALLILGTLGLARSGRRQQLVWLWAIGPATPLLLGLISIVRPVFIEHYAIAGLPGTLILAAAGAARLPGRWLRLAAAAALAALGLTAIQNQYHNPAYAKSPDWPGLAHFLESTGRPGEIILVNLPDPAFEYYYRGPLPFENAPPGPLAAVGVAAAEGQIARLAAGYQHLRFLLAPSPGYDPDGWVGRQLLACCELTEDGFVGRFRVQAFDTPAGSLAGRQPLEAAFGDGLALTGYRWAGPQPGAGGVARLTLFWTTRAVPQRDYTVFVHVLAPDGFQLLGADGPPRAGAAPTSRWSTGAVVIDPHVIDLGDLPAGRYGVEVGLYVGETRLMVVGPDGTRSDRVRLPEPLQVGPAP